MKAIRTTAVVKNGQITVDVPAREGTNFEVVLVPHRTREDVEKILERINRRFHDIAVTAPDPQTLKEWIQEGRQ